MTQEQLEEAVGTQQPAIARIEAGSANVSMATLVKLAVALDTTIRIDLEPVEMLGHEPRVPRWWERDCVHAVAVLPDDQRFNLTAQYIQHRSAPALGIDPTVESLVLPRERDVALAANWRHLASHQPDSPRSITDPALY